MMRQVVGGIVMAAVVAAVPASAQEPQAGPVASPAAPRPADRSELRHQIYVMEGALSRAVEFGAQRLNRELRSVAPEMFLLAGNAQARGVYLDGYGIFFDVAVPMLRQSMMWSLRMMLQQDDTGTRQAIAEIRRHIQAETDPRQRQALESAMARLEAQATPFANMNRQPPPPPFMGGPAGVSSPSMPRQDAAPPPAQPPPSAPATSAGPDFPWLLDTNRRYTEEVQRALIDAMIDFSAPMAIGNDEWLTVAARDNEQRDALAPQNPYEEVSTFMLQVKGSDLAAYRSGRINRDEARKRVQVQQF